MSPYICFLVTVLYNDKLLKCALKLDKTKYENDWYDYPMEPDSRERLHQMLPLHVQSCGPIVGVERIFEIEVNC